MLVLTRKPGQKIHIGPNITITVVKLAAGQVQIGVEAPPEVPIWRPEAGTRKGPQASEAKGHGK